MQHLVSAFMMVAAGAAGIGYFWGGSNEAKTQPQKRPVEQSQNAGAIPKAAPRLPSAASHIKAPVASPNLDSKEITLTAKDATLSSAMAMALSEPNPTKRLQALTNALSSMTASNWREGIKAFSEQSKLKGQNHYQEWLLFAQHAGEVAGADAMKYFTGKNSSLDVCRECLTGWAAKKPSEAIDWLETQAPPNMRDLIFGAAVRGVVQTNPDQAISILEQLPQEYRKKYTGGLVSGIVQSQGIEKALEVFNGIEKRAQADGTQNSEYVRKMFGELADSVFSANRKRGNPQASASWLSNHLGQPYVSSAHIDNVAADYAKVDPSGTIGWLDSIKTFPKGEPVGYRSAIRTWVDKYGFESASTWLQNNQANPNYDRMAIGLATTVTNINDFNSIVGTIRDQTLRDKAQKFAPKPQPQTQLLPQKRQ